LKKIIITPGMARVLQSRRIKVKCASCGLTIPVYSGRYPVKCPSCQVRFQGEVEAPDVVETYSAVYEDFMSQGTIITSEHSWTCEAVQRDLLRQSAYPFLAGVVEQDSLYESLWFLNFPAHREPTPEVFGLLEAAFTKIEEEPQYWGSLGSKTIGVYPGVVVEELPRIAREGKKLVQVPPPWLREMAIESPISESRQFQLLVEAYLHSRPHCDHYEAGEYASNTLLLETVWSGKRPPSSVLNPRHRGGDPRIVVGGFRFTSKGINKARQHNKKVQHKILSRKNRGGVVSRIRSFRSMLQKKQSKAALVKAQRYHKTDPTAGRLHRELGRMHRSVGTFQTNDEGYSAIRHIRPEEAALRMFSNGTPYPSGTVRYFRIQGGLDENIFVGEVLPKSTQMEPEGGLYIRAGRRIEEIVISAFDMLLTEEQVEGLVRVAGRVVKKSCHPGIIIRVYNDVRNAVQLHEELFLSEKIKAHSIVNYTDTMVLLEADDAAAKKAMAIKQRYVELRKSRLEALKRQRAQLTTTSKEGMEAAKERIKQQIDKVKTDLTAREQRELERLKEGDITAGGPGKITTPKTIRGFGPEGEVVEIPAGTQANYNEEGGKQELLVLSGPDTGKTVMIDEPLDEAFLGLSLWGWSILMAKVGVIFSIGNVVLRWWRNRFAVFGGLTHEDEIFLRKFLVYQETEDFILGRDSANLAKNARKLTKFIRHAYADFNRLFDATGNVKHRPGLWLWKGEAYREVEVRRVVKTEMGTKTHIVRTSKDWEFWNWTYSRFFKLDLDTIILLLEELRGSIALNEKVPKELQEKLAQVYEEAEPIERQFAEDYWRNFALQADKTGHPIHGVFSSREYGLIIIMFKYPDFLDFLGEGTIGFFMPLVLSVGMTVYSIKKLGWAVSKIPAGLRGSLVWIKNYRESGKETIFIENKSQAAVAKTESSRKSILAGLKEHISSFFSNLWRYLTKNSIIYNMKDPYKFVLSWVDEPFVLGKAPIMCMKSRFKGSLLTSGDRVVIHALSKKESFGGKLSKDPLPEDIVTLEGSDFPGEAYAFLSEVFTAITHSPTFLELPQKEAQKRVMGIKEKNKFISRFVLKDRVVGRVPMLGRSKAKKIPMRPGDVYIIADYMGEKDYKAEGVLPMWRVVVTTKDYSGDVLVDVDTLYASLKNLREAVDTDVGLSKVMSLYQKL